MALLTGTGIGNEGQIIEVYDTFKTAGCKSTCGAKISGAWADQSSQNQ